MWSPRVEHQSRLENSLSAFLVLLENEGVATTLGGPLEEVAKAEAKEAEALLDTLKIPVGFLQSAYNLHD